MRKKSPKKSGGGKSAAVSGSPMDVKLLEQIVKLMSANDLSTVEVRDGARRVLLKRGQDVAAPTMMHSGSYAPPPAAGAPATAPSPVVDETAGMTPIKSPMVGTFYSSPSPDAKPFVQVGSTVDEESDVCIIEAMKVFNNIKAECHGTIARILVTNGQTVEFGQVLFLVKP